MRDYSTQSGIKNVNYKHGKSKSNIYSIWKGMKRRCLNTKSKEYPYYGGRGIKVCERWLDFRNFYTDMGERPEGMSLERVNNDGNYAPDNVIWASQEIQNQNQRNTIYIKNEYGEKERMKAWCKRKNIPYATIKARIRSGLSPQEAIEKPCSPRNKNKPTSFAVWPKLDKKDVVKIRSLYSEGHKQKEISSMYGVSQSLVSRIINHKRW